ncbi:MAG: Methyltransferase type 11 [Ilumatobacteraceae bacterium]|nr:Methyltransferase type 11 [Ilumatobacteraceae bacterium]
MLSRLNDGRRRAVVIESGDVDEVQRAYGLRSALYIELFGTTAQVHADDLALIGRHLTIRPGAVLDVGCGPGHLTEHLRSLDIDAAGIDIVPEFILHARSTHPLGRYEVGSMEQLPAAAESVAGILAWYSLIHLLPDALDRVLGEFRRVLVPGGTLVAGFFPGERIITFEHKVATAWFWPVDEFSARLGKAGFTEVERQLRPAEDGHRSHAAIAAIAETRRTR